VRPWALFYAKKQQFFMIYSKSFHSL